MLDRRTLASIWIVALAVAIVLYAANLFLGDVNQDEGWYLYAARSVAEGRAPYLDFATTQGPVMPYVYAAAQPLVDRFGTAGGRLFTVLLAWSGALGAAWLAARLSGRRVASAAAVAAFCLVALNAYQSYFCTIVKTYALGSLLLVLGFLMLTCRRGGHVRLRALAAGVLFGLAAGTRTSAGVALPALFAWLLWSGRLRGDRGAAARQAAVWLFAGGALSGIAIFAPFTLRAPLAVWFALVEYHAGRSAGGVLVALAYKAGFVSRVVQAYFTTCAAFVAAGLFALTVPRGEQDERPPDGENDGDGGLLPVLPGLWTTVAAATGLHLVAPFPYDDYQALVYPLFAVGTAVWVMRLAAATAHPRRALRWVVGVVCLVCMAASFSSPINQDWVVGERDRIWWPVRKETPLQRLRRAGLLLRSQAAPGEFLLTQDPYLAVESGLSLPAGLELGPFSYFPDWSREKAEACHVLNRDMMEELLRTCPAPVAAFSGYGLAIRCPEVAPLSRPDQEHLWNIVMQRYVPFRTIDNFGHGRTQLRVLLSSGE